jgi:hypothetical protein
MGENFFVWDVGMLWVIRRPRVADEGRYRKGRLRADCCPERAELLP